MLNLRMLHRLYILLLAFSVLVSCKKDKDTEEPVIAFELPLSHSTHDAGNYVRVKARVTDNLRLESVTLKAQSLDGSISASETVVFNPGENALNIDRNLLLGDIHTNTGVYQLVVEAYDGTNRKKAYVDININEIPRQFRKMIIVQKSGTGYTVDSLAGAAFIPFIFQSTDFSGAAISQYHQQLYLAGHKQGNLQAYNLNNNTPAWAVPADMPPSTIPLFYTNYYNAASLQLWQSMAGMGGGSLKAFGPNGAVQKNIPMHAAHYAGSIAFTAGHIAVSEWPLVSGGTPLLSYYFNSGFGLAFTTSAPFAATHLFVLSSNQLVVLGNNGPQGELRIYNSSTNGFWEQVNLPPGKLYDAVQLDANTYIIAHESGLLRFEQSTTNLVNITMGNKAQKLYYDVYSGILYAAEGSQLKSYHPVTGSAGPVINAVDSIKAILPHYNK